MDTREYKKMCEEACKGTEALLRAERVAVLRVRFAKAVAAFEENPHPENFRYLLTAMCGYQNTLKAPGET